MTSRSRAGLFAIAVLVSLPSVAIAGWAVKTFIASLFDPCAVWGRAADGHLELSLPPGSPCAGVRGYGESRLAGGIRTASVPGGVIAAGVLAVIGTFSRRRRIVLTGAILMAAETLVVFTIAPLTAIAAGTYFWIASRLPRPAPTPAAL